MAVEITFVRHGESVANVAGRWQGQGDSPLSEAGREQAAALARRLSGMRFDRVVASDLSRAWETAAALGREVEPDPAWREVDVGAWEGLTRPEVAERFPEQIDALAKGQPIRIGGGESWHDLELRVDAALARLRASLVPGQRALVVTHGGVIHTLMAGLLGLRQRRPRPIGRVRNTSVTTVRLEGDAPPALLRFNDAGHALGIGAPVGEVPRHRAWTAVLLIAQLGEADYTIDPRLPELDHVYPRAPDDDLVRAMPSLAARHPRARVGIRLSPTEVAAFARATLGSAPEVAAPEPGALASAVVTDVAVSLVAYNVGQLTGRSSV